MLYARLGMKRSVFLSLVLMAVSNLSFAGLAAAGHSNWAMAGAIGFENIASGIGGVTVGRATSRRLCDLRYTAISTRLIVRRGQRRRPLLTGTSPRARSSSSSAT